MQRPQPIYLRLQLTDSCWLFFPGPEPPMLFPSWDAQEFREPTDHSAACGPPESSATCALAGCELSDLPDLAFPDQSFMELLMFEHPELADLSDPVSF